MTVIVYLLLITACFAYVYSKKRKWLTWTVGIFLSIVTGLCVVIIYNGKIFIPSTHKKEIKLIAADNFVKIFNKDMSYRKEISFEKYIYKVRQDELKFKEKIDYACYFIFAFSGSLLYLFVHKKEKVVNMDG